MISNEGNNLSNPVREFEDAQNDSRKAVKVKNKRYRQFLDKNEIELLGTDEFDYILDCLNEDNHKMEARSLNIAMYLTGARPNEVLRLKAKDVRKSSNYYIFSLKGSKNGLPRKIHISTKNRSLNRYAKELFLYANGLHPEAYIFHNFISKRYIPYKKKNGEYKRYVQITNNLTYWFSKWFKDMDDKKITPYFYRHNRFSSMMENGADWEMVRQIKGAKSVSSVMPYAHMSAKSAKTASKYLS